MKEIINQLVAVRAALGTLNIVSSDHNVDVIQGCKQLLDRITVTLQRVDAEAAKDNPKSEEEENERDDQS